MDNGPAKQLGLSESIQKAGHLWADPIEVYVLADKLWWWPTFEITAKFIAGGLENCPTPLSRCYCWPTVRAQMLLNA